MDRDKKIINCSDLNFFREAKATLQNTLFVSDLDGTLLNSEARLSEKTVDLLNSAISQGVNFTIATARTPATVSEIIRNVDMRLPAIVMTGATEWSPTHGYSNTNFFPEDIARRLVEVYKKAGLPTFIYTMPRSGIEIFHLGPLSRQETTFMQERAHSPFKHFNLDSLDAAGADLSKVLLFYSIQPTVPTEKCYKTIRQIPDLNPLFYHDIFGPEIGILEVFARQSTKAKAIARLARKNGFTNIVAFGDNINDLPMLKAASLSVAVENAIPQVKEMAQVIIPPNTDNSVAEYITSATKILRNG